MVLYQVSDDYIGVHQPFALRSSDTRAVAGRLRGGFADFAELIFFPSCWPAHLQRPRAGMHADRGLVSFHRVLELIAGFDLQRLANLPGIVVCPFLVTVEWGMNYSLPLIYSLHLYYALPSHPLART